MNQKEKSQLTKIATQKEAFLIKKLTEYKSVIVAYSGGVDSTYLADCANDVLGKNALIVIADSPSLPRTELSEAIDLAILRKWNLKVIKTDEYKNSDYLANKGNRCFHCKNSLFENIKKLIKNENTKIVYGAVEDDKNDIRPGEKAAQNHGALAPLQIAKLFKSEIRILSRIRNLPTASKASFACLGSRFPTGTSINLEKLSQVEKAEEELKIRGFRQFRVRHHNDICRIEIELDEFQKIILNKEEIVKAIKKFGYKFVTLDLSGYQTGSSA
ncbi:MAG: ATP-dependent sacrificial sulfur transferase LarE [Verrucomicrobiota bacterium]|nr:ATP-dependent sacrificial sulfur transferase LarE [Verrucomicrobiota bacterium]